MKASVIFDLDQTLVDTSGLEIFRKQRNWNEVYGRIASLKPFVGISEFIKELNSKSIEIVIITTSPSSYCSRIIANFGWKVSGSVCYHDVRPNIKPHPQAFIKAISDYNLNIRKTISVGDRDIDILASHKVNIPSIACTWASPDSKLLLTAKPTYIANSSSEMVSIISNFHGL